MLDEIIHGHEEKSTKCDFLFSHSNSNDDDALQNKRRGRSKSTTTTTTSGPQTSMTIFALEPRVVLTRLPQKYLVNYQKQQNDVHPEIDQQEFKVDNDFNDSQSDILDPLYDPFDDDPDSPVGIKSEEVSESEKIDDESSISECIDTFDISNSSPKPINIIIKKLVKKSTPPPRGTKRGSKISAKTNKQELKCIQEEEDESKESSVTGPMPKKSRKKGIAYKKRRRKPLMDPSDPDTTSPKLKVAYLNKRRKVACPCWYCRQNFPTPLLCMEHTKNVHLSPNSIDQVCPRCSKICTVIGLESHLVKCNQIPSGVILQKPFLCKLCHRTYRSRRNLSVHMITHSPQQRQEPSTEQPSTCDQCDRTFKTEKSLRNHKRVVHTAVTGKVKCDVCEFEVKNEYCLTRHKYFEHTEQGRKAKEIKRTREREKGRILRLERSEELTTTFCGSCNIEFYTRLGLVKHEKEYHLEDLVTNSICELCGARFVGQYGLKAHMTQVHSNTERPYLCGKCGTRHKTKATLKSHDIKAHTEEGRVKYNAYMRELARRRKMRKLILNSTT